MWIWHKNQRWPIVGRKGQRNNFIANTAVITWAAGISVFVPQGVLAEEDSELQWSSELGVWSAYVTEGRDNLTSSGLISADITVESETWSAGMWLGRALTESFYEWQGRVGRSASLMDRAIWRIGATHVVTRESSEWSTDVQFDLGLDLRAYSWLDAEATLLYSIAEKGAFATIGISTPWKLNDTVELRPFILTGFDFGFRTREHHGPNHIETGTRICISLGERITVGAVALRSFSLSDIRRESRQSGLFASDKTVVGAFAQMAF